MASMEVPPLVEVLGQIPEFRHFAAQPAAALSTDFE